MEGKDQLELDKKEEEMEEDKKEKDACGTKKKKRKMDGLRTESRVDYLDVSDFMSQKFERTNEGFLKGRAVLTNVGVFTYMDADGNIRKELRPPEEVFDPDSLDTLQMSPLTNNHPNEPVDAENAKRLQVGFVGENVYSDGYHLSGPITITDAQSVEDVKAGKRALSAGYKVDIEDKQGIWMGVPYDAIQRNIRYNHVAIVDRGRAGDNAVMKLDSVDAICTDMKNNTDSIDVDKTDKSKFNKEEDIMKKIKLDGVEYEAESKVIEELHVTTNKLDAITKDLEQVNKDLETVKGERDSLKDENDTLKKDVEDLKKTQPEKVDEAVKARLSLIQTADKADVEIKDDMSTVDIKKAVIVKAFPKAEGKLDDAQDAYIDARFDAAVEYLEEREDINDKNAKEVSDVKSDGNSTERSDSRTADQARQDMIDRQLNASQPKE